MLSKRRRPFRLSIVKVREIALTALGVRHQTEKSLLIGLHLPNTLVRPGGDEEAECRMNAAEAVTED